MKKRIHQIDLFRKYPIEVQKEWFNKLIKNASYTEFGIQHGFKSIESYSDFQKQVPLQTYTEVKPWVDRLMKGEKALLWPTETRWFAQSSGTTSARSKLIPVTRESLVDCHQKGGKDLVALYFDNCPNGKVYNKKHLTVGGSTRTNPLSADSYSGDLSAILVKNLPWWAEITRVPSRETALLDQWEEKIERMARESMQEDVGLMVGVPSWTLVICQRILEVTGAKNLLEVWPNLEAFWHGGVGFEPYRKEFEKLIPEPNMNYFESYNASEGFFGIQDDITRSDLLLMLDYGIFYEFIPMSDFKGVESEVVVGLEDVKIGEQYAVVISTNGGLWRYIIGDTICFTETDPYRFRVSGRTASYINVFGEELIVDNAERAVAAACAKFDAQLRDYTVAPVYMEGKSKGAHQWLFEFIEAPSSTQLFMDYIDEYLQKINSDYQAKRTDGLAMMSPQYLCLETGQFNAWLKSQGKLGGQHKIPRLMNNRSIVEQILQFSSPNFNHTPNAPLA